MASSRMGWIGALALALGSAAAGPALAAGFPDHTVKIVVPFSPGGSSDITARLVAEKMSEQWKEPVIVENRAGAGTTIGAAYVAAAAPDGYTLLLVGPGTHATSSALYKDLSYDAVKSFSAVGMIGRAPFAIVVNASSDIKTMKDLIGRARSKPEGVSYSSSGAGAGPHLVTEILARATGVKFLHVPFKGSSLATTALFAGQVDFSTADASAVQYVKTGKMRALAVTTERPSPVFPGVPPIAETVPGFSYPLTVGLLAPAGTPREVMAELNRALNRALADEAVKTRLFSLGFEPAPMTPEQFQAFMEGEVQRYAKIVKEIGLKLN
ncbi:MAG TPA: tripartite tricarboxylate transporter substrate binding protein [Burkholderiales bacterium]